MSSQASPHDAEHYIAPIHGDFDRARKAVECMPRTTVLSLQENYVYAECRSPLLRFVDDLELYFDGTVIQVRSASRLGRRDFGVNRRRVEALRRLIENKR